jgi:hypothetical protein
MISNDEKLTHMMAKEYLAVRRSLESLKKDCEDKRLIEILENALCNGR